MFASARIEGTSQKAEVKQLVPKGSVGRSMQPVLAPKKRKAVKASSLLKRSRRVSSEKVKEAVEPDEASPKYLRPTPKVRAAPADTKDKVPKRRRKSMAGNKGLSSTELEPVKDVKDEGDYSPLKEETDYVATSKKVKAEALKHLPNPLNLKRKKAKNRIRRSLTRN